MQTAWPGESHMALILCTEKGRGERAHSARLGAWSDDHTKQGRELGEGEREPVTCLQARHLSLPR